ncbi:hypothetical protein VSDG_07720 [Cytospora chrysosperma]|uniref:Peptidase S8/S53 domain-containing protein n=1 Tax=Cytospora chrysosperma TaxID=252740 RepID=A0A423VJ92_CYTCH|nr:hypothetical protein VSDG_07720 [Valsa sordida]
MAPVIHSEDASDRLYLSLLSSPEDHDKPNTGTYSFNPDAQGQGTWLVMIDTGYDWQRFPEEFGTPGEPRPLSVWNVPEDIRNRELRAEEIAGGLHWPPNDDRDYGDPFEGVPEGHGTQCAILAGGLQSGVARRAGLYLIKAGGAVMDQAGLIVEEDVCADSLISALGHILDLLRDGGLPRGKTILVIDTLWNIKDMRKNTSRGEEGYMEWHGKVANALDDLDSLGGVLVTVSAGNDGREKPPGRTDEYMPNILSARHGSPLIITGAVNNRGQLAKLSSPGTANVPITCYAVGKDIMLIDLSIDQKRSQEGTSFSAAIVAGQAACAVSDPLNEEQLKWCIDDIGGDRIGNRLKNWFSREGLGSFQRVAEEDILDPTSTWEDYPIPERVNVVCNSCATHNLRDGRNMGEVGGKIHGAEDLYREVDGKQVGKLDGKIKGQIDEESGGEGHEEAGGKSGTKLEGAVDVDGRPEHDTKRYADGDADGNVDGSVDGDVDGNVDGDVDGNVDGDVDGNVDGDVDGDAKETDEEPPSKRHKH